MAKLVVRLPGFVTEDAFLAALSSDADRAAVRASRYFAFVRGKPTAAALPKRLSLCWITFADAATALAFVRNNATALQFRESDATAPPLGAQFDSALYQHVHTAAAPLRSTAQPFSFDSDPDFATFRSVYDAGDVPLLRAVITTAEQGAAALAPKAPLPVSAIPPRATIVDLLLFNANLGKKPKKPKAAKPKKPRDPSKPPKGKRARAKWLRAQAEATGEPQKKQRPKKRAVQRK